MAALLEEIMYLFTESHSDLKKVFEFKEVEITTCVVDMEKCTLDMREIMENCLNDEEDRLATFKSQADQISELRQKNIEQKDHLSNIQKQLSSAHKELDCLDSENKQLLKDSNQKAYEIDRLYQDLSEIPKLQCKLETLRKQLADSDHRIEDTIRVSREAEADRESLMDHNHELIRQAEKDSNEIHRLQALDEDSHHKIRTVNLYETSLKNHFIYRRMN